MAVLGIVPTGEGPASPVQDYGWFGALGSDGCLDGLRVTENFKCSSFCGIRTI